MGQETFVISNRPSEANLVKLSGNFLIASVLESLGEAFALVRKSGIDPQRYLNILTSALFSAPVYRTYVPISADEKQPADGFKMSLGLKYKRLALAAADALTSSPSERRAGSSCDATANAIIPIPSGPDRRSRTAGCARLPNDSHKVPSSRRHRHIPEGSR